MVTRLIKVKIMNKKEWKLQHAANRRLWNGLFSNMSDGEISPSESKNFNIANDMFRRELSRLHWSFEYALFTDYKVAYPISENRWAIRHNTTTFNEVRTKNQLERQARRNYLFFGLGD